MPRQLMAGFFKYAADPAMFMPNAIECHDHTAQTSMEIDTSLSPPAAYPRCFANLRVMNVEDNWNPCVTEACDQDLGIPKDTA